MDIIEKIQEQIAHHRAEILKLESALDVIVSVSGKTSKQAPLITVRRTIEHEAAPKKAKGGKNSKTDRERSKKLEAAILADLLKHGPSRSRDIRDRLRSDTKTIANRLYPMHKRGEILHREDGRYSLVQQEGDASTAPSTEAA